MIVGEGEVDAGASCSTPGPAAAPGALTAGAQASALRAAQTARIVRTAAREIIRDLDALPRPAWDLVDVERYRQIWLRAPRLLLDEHRDDARVPVSLQLVREADLRPALHGAIAGSVVDEIAWLQATYRPDHLWIADDIFGLKPGWIERFADLGSSRAARGARSSACCAPTA